MPPAKRLVANDEEKARLRAVGRRIGDLRHELGMNQSELARKSGIHRNYISRLESQGSNVHLLSLIRIANALEIELSEMLKDL